MKRLAQQSLQTLARAVGCELIPKWRLPNRELAMHLAELFAHYRIDVVLDVGANRGQYRDFLRGEVGFTGQIISFEPMSAHAERLRDRARGDGRWDVHQCAVGRTPGTLPLNVMRDDSLSSFRAPQGEHVREDLDAENVVVRVEQVPVRTLAELWPALSAKHGVRRPYLKMDTQGFDLEVIGGAGAALTEVVALQSEIALRALYQAAPGYLDSIAQLQGSGFEMTGIFPVSRDAQLRVIECDCVMLNQREASASR
jgi:FkbM family methyltransferase